MDKIFTHTDLDGIGCAILAKLYNPSIEVEYCDYNNINEKICDFLNNNIPLGDLYITDISVSNEMAERIDSVISDFVLIDHHSTALELNKYKWCTVKVEDNDTGLKTCGAELFYYWLVKNGGLDRSKFLDRFVEIVRDYDTWRWSTLGEEGIICKQFNDLLQIYGRDYFVEWCLKYLRGNKFPNFQDTEYTLLKLRQHEIDRYVEDKDKQLIIHSLKNWTCGYVFADRFVSELGNRLCKRHPEIDFMVIIDVAHCTVSYRTIRGDIDLGKDVAKFYGGGGHPKAAGSQFDRAIQLQIIQKLFGE